MKKNALIVGGLIIVAGASFAGGRAFLPANTLYAKVPGAPTCVAIHAGATTFTNLATSPTGIQAQITSKNTGRSYLLFEDNTCTTKPVYFR